VKNIFLVVVLVLGLNASVDFCEDAHNRAYKHHQAYNFAHGRMDVSKMRVENKMEIFYAEKALVNCGAGWHLYDDWIQWRLDLIEVGKKLEKL